MSIASYILSKQNADCNFLEWFNCLTIEEIVRLALSENITIS